MPKAHHTESSRGHFEEFTSGYLADFARSDQHNTQNLFRFWRHFIPVCIVSKIRNVQVNSVNTWMITTVLLTIYTWNFELTNYDPSTLESANIQSTNVLSERQ